jgi:hypothetical protein
VAGRPASSATSDTERKYRKTNQLGQALGATGSRQDAQHDFGEAKHSLAARGRNTVVAGQSELATSTKARAIDGSNNRLAAMG